MRRLVFLSVLLLLLPTLALATVSLLTMAQEPDNQADNRADNQADTQSDTPKTFETWSFEDLSDARAESQQAYLSFLERSSMRMGLYHLPQGGSDGQNPHDQDESYYVVAGKSRFTCDGETVDVSPGDVLFVAAGLDHRFHDIGEDLELIVFFSAAKPMTADGDDGSEDD